MKNLTTNEKKILDMIQLKIDATNWALAEDVKNENEKGEYNNRLQLQELTRVRTEIRKILELPTILETLENIGE